MSPKPLKFVPMNPVNVPKDANNKVNINLKKVNSYLVKSSIYLASYIDVKGVSGDIRTESAQVTIGYSLPVFKGKAKTQK